MVTSLVVLFAFIIEDIVRLHRFRALDSFHPVALFGALAKVLEGIMNRPQQGVLSDIISRVFGGLAFALLVCLAVAIGLAIDFGLAELASTAGVISVVASNVIGVAILVVFLCSRQLFDYALEVAAAPTLRHKRKRAARLVGRDLSSSSASEVSCATIESLGENFSDALVAPIFYFCCFGFAGLLGYKAINTLDSQWGYRSQRFRNFGFIAAKLDDVANFIPARLAAGLLLSATAFRSSGRVGIFTKGLAYVARHARGFDSPNAPWPEAALSYAGKIRLGGPRNYPQNSKQSSKHRWLGKGRKTLTRQDIINALAVCRRARWALVVLLVGLLLVLLAVFALFSAFL